jgi:DNA-binding winged helix-turn-helix (wHTH) protein
MFGLLCISAKSGPAQQGRQLVAASAECLEDLLRFSWVLRKDGPMQVTFGGYRLDLGTRQLFHGQTEVRLSPKAFDLLHVLIDNRTRALSKAELHDRLWPGTFVTEANLALLVTELRRALGDDPRASRFVRTVHRFGYAFCGQIPGEAAPVASGITCWLVWKGGEIRLTDGENIIGRDPSAAVRLDFPSVSRRHARIVVSADGAVVEDLGSKNGTFLRDQRVTGAVRLVDLDALTIGSITLTARILGGGERTLTVHEH